MFGANNENVFVVGVMNAVKKMRKETLFKEKTCPFTSARLCSEIISKMHLDKNSNVLVLFTVEFAVVLKNLGFKNVTVITDVFDKKMEKLVKKVLGYNYNTIKEIENMKFDVVLGNPPYTKLSEKGSNQAIYQEFYNLANKLSSSVIAMVTPKDMMLKMHTGAIDKVKIVQRTPCYVNLNRIERYFPRVGSTFCYFIIDETKEETIVELPTGKISANILESSFQYIEHNKVFDFLYKYGNGDKYPFTEATVGKYLLEDKKGIYTNYETQEKCSISSGKKFREHNPVNTKFITPKMTSGKANELFIDYKGEYIWSSNGFYSCILDPDDNPDVIKKNAMIIMEEFKQAFEGVNFKGFVWNNFFKHVAKKHLKEKKID